ncbi:hypothetical protein PITC_072650 [Penicillium italicum]|uniref:Uncharacterized protein n=1 Tax=Penicillium italicum TaxID=40296 RepID=A0A0A2KBS2_PENIT|nr:hypothetical protein PITC_072650 [Penicillium italicum]
MGESTMAYSYAHLLVRGHFDWCEDVENDIAMKAKAAASTSTVPKLDEKFEHLLIRQQFDWWEDVENDVAMKAKSIPTTSTVPIKAPKLDVKYEHLLVRKQFDWLEDVENDIAMKTNALAVDNKTPTTNTEDLATAFDIPTTTNDDEYAQHHIPERENCLEDVEKDVIIKASSLSVETHIPTTSTKYQASTSTSSKLNDECTQPSLREHDDWVEDSENNTTLNTEPVITDTEITTIDTSELDTASTDSSTIKDLDDEDIRRLDIEHENWSEYSENGISENTEDIVTNNDPLATNNGPITAIESNDLPDLLDHETSDSADDVEATLPMDNECPNDNIEAISSAEGPVTAVESDASQANLLHPKTFELAKDVENSLYMEDLPDWNTVAKSSSEIVKSPQPVPNSQPDESGVSDDDVDFDEYKYRTMIGSEDYDIHHWNWFGHAVYAPSATPPAVSLAFMQARPKAPKGRDELRVISILNRALHQIDPVILRIDGGNEGLLQMHGSKLIEACDGHTYTYYSPHGKWLSDDFSMRRMIVPDAGASVVPGNAIINGEFVIGNGIFENGPLICRNEWMDWRDNLVAAAQKPACSPRRLTWKPTPSKFLIESMASKKRSPPNRVPSYSFAPLEIMNMVIHKAWPTAKNFVHTPISLSLGVMGPMINKTPGPNTALRTPLSFRTGITGNVINKVWATAKDVLIKSFVLSLRIMQAIIKRVWGLVKVAFRLPMSLSDILPFSSG